MKRGGPKPGAGRKPCPQPVTAKMLRDKQRRYIDAVANWQTAWNLRKQGMTYKQVGEIVGVHFSRAAVLCYNYDEYLLNNKTKKAA